ncbi:MAG: magnesium/cobalt transporter CorA [Candidatus Micrarchaeia archaeon]|jgi:magnesium transporter
MIRALIYSKEKVHEEFEMPAIAKAISIKSNTVWVDIDSPLKEDLDELVEIMKIHELSVDDARKTNQRTKIEVYPNYAYVVMRSFKTIVDGADIALNNEEVDLLAGKTTQLNFFLSQNCLLTHSFENATTQEEVYEKVKKNPYLMSLGADYLLYAIMDATVDDYFPLFNAITEKLDALEDRVLDKPTKATLGEALRLKKLLFAFKKEVQPLRDVTSSLARREVRFVSDANAPYFRDVYDHIVRLMDNIEMNRDLVSNIMEAYLSSVSNSLNKSMKRVAAISTILMPPTLLGSIFGMNFKVIPESEWEYGFYLVIGIMLAMLIGTYWYFKKEDWL